MKTDGFNTDGDVGGDLFVDVERMIPQDIADLAAYMYNSIDPTAFSKAHPEDRAVYYDQANIVMEFLEKRKKDSTPPNGGIVYPNIYPNTNPRIYNDPGVAPASRHANQAATHGPA